MSEPLPERFAVDNGDGWTLELERHSEAPAGRQPRPVLMVPGYAMNASILSYHPRGASLVSYLADTGREIWTCNLRGQGQSQPTGKPGRFGLKELSLVDLPAILGAVREHSETGHDEIDLVGCSLGASMIYAYLAHHPDSHGIGSLVAMGGPLRWEGVHPLVKLAFSSGRLAGAIPVKGTRRAARRLLPLARHVTPLMSIYMNTEAVDLSEPDQLVKTVEDPVRWINRQVARWIQQGDLVVDGLNVVEALTLTDLPIFAVLANADGIVPPATARSVEDVLGPEQVDVLEVGDAERWAAHADLFIGDDAQSRVFSPIAEWLDLVGDI